MQKFGYEHLRFSQNTNKQRHTLLITGCLSILIFEYHIAENLTIYSINIPNPLIKLSLVLVALWATIQFVFNSLDDYVDWKKNFLVDDKIRPMNTPQERTIFIEIFSLSKGKIRYSPIVGHTYAGPPPNITIPIQIETGIKSCIEQLEKALKNEIKTIEKFQKWYKRFSWITIFRFSVLEFALPLLFIVYAVLICQFYPILPK